MFTDEQVYRIVLGSIGPLYRLLTPVHVTGAAQVVVRTKLRLSYKQASTH